MSLALVAACAENRVIGRDGGLPWHLPADLARFRRLTIGHAVIMGRRTWESIGGRPLAGRRNLVVTSHPLTAPGVEAFASLEAALEAVRDDPEPCVVGGEGIYRAALPRATRIHLTRVHASPTGDTFFPEVEWSEWKLGFEERHEADARHACAFTFQTWERVREAPAPVP